MKKASLPQTSSRTNLIIAVVVAISVIIVSYLLYVTLAAGPTVSVEPESNLASTSKAKVIDDAAASGGKALQFAGAPVVDPDPEPDPEPAPNPNPGPAPAGRLLWSDAPASPVGTSAPLRNWTNASSQIYAGTSVRVVADPVKGKAIEFFGAANQSRGGHQRGELVPTYSNIKSGEVLWLAFDLWVKEPLGFARSNQQVWQIKSAPSENSGRFFMNVNNHQAGLWTGTGDRYIGPTPGNKWVRLIFGFNTRTNGSSMEIWYDGKLAIPRYNTHSLFVAGDDKVYLKVGVYRSAPKPYDITMRMANFKLGTTKAIVE